MIAAANRNLLVVAGAGSGALHRTARRQWRGLRRFDVERRDAAAAHLRLSPGQGRLDVTTATGGALKIEGEPAVPRPGTGSGSRAADAGRPDYRLMRYAATSQPCPWPRPRTPRGRRACRRWTCSRSRARRPMARNCIGGSPAAAGAGVRADGGAVGAPVRRARRATAGCCWPSVTCSAVNLMLLGTDKLGSGKMPAAAGLWWLLLPLLAIGAWF